MQYIGRVFFVLVLALGMVRPAAAIFGVGDISTDPAAYAQMTQMIAQMKEMYENAKKQLDTLTSVQSTIRDAQEAYESLSNVDLKSFAEGFKPRNFAASKDKINALRADLAQMESTGDRAASFYQYQYGRLANLESLAILQAVSSTNTERAAGKVSPAASAQITAQSTASLAALAATQEQRHQQEDLANANARKAERDAIFNTKGIYNAMGGKKERAP